MCQVVSGLPPEPRYGETLTQDWEEAPPHVKDWEHNICEGAAFPENDLHFFI